MWTDPVPDHLLLDVFTDTPFTGNPLAVFVDQGDLPTGSMQAIARELNLSESVFLRPPPQPGAAAHRRSDRTGDQHSLIRKPPLQGDRAAT